MTTTPDPVGERSSALREQVARALAKVDDGDGSCWMTNSDDEAEYFAYADAVIPLVTEDVQRRIGAHLQSIADGYPTEPADLFVDGLRYAATAAVTYELEQP